MKYFHLIASSLFLGMPVLGKSSSQIRNFDFQSYFDRQYEYCVSERRKHALTAESIDYADVDGDGEEEAILVGYTCNGGTGGPDIHAVYKMTTAQNVQEMAFDQTKVFKGVAVYDDLIGNTNFSLAFKNGVLREDYADGSCRENPLIVYRRWNGRVFQIVDVEKAQRFKASFDCAKASSPNERMICGLAYLADADLKMDRLYKRLLRKLSVSQRDTLRQDQAKWLFERDQNCIPYKCFSGDPPCLQTAYTKRIEDLEKWPMRLGSHP